MNEPKEFNPHIHIYRMKSGQRIVGIVLLIFGLIFGVAVWSGVITGAREPDFLEMMFPVAFSLFAGIFTVRTFRNSVRLSETAIELRSISGHKELPFDEIKGRRRYLDRGDENSPSVWHLVLEPNDDRFVKLDIEELYHFDDFFFEWFNGLSNLDELDKTRPRTLDWCRKIVDHWRITTL